MSRAALDYSERRAFAGQVGIDVTTPVEGFYKFRLRADAIRCGVHILFGPPLDPDTGETMDRSPRWQCFVNGRYFDDFDRVYPACAREPIDEAEYRRLCARLRWAEDAAPESAYADPTRRIDLLSRSTPLPF